MPSVSVIGKCRKCGRTTGSYASLSTAISAVASRKCPKGGNCEMDHK